MSTVIAIVGVPGTGKSTLMKEFLEIPRAYDEYWELSKPVDLVEGQINGDVFVMGKYEEGEVFSGTDRLSMAVQPKAIEYLQGDPAKFVVFEGDRLTTVSFFQAVKQAGHTLHIIELTIPDELREQRYIDRGSDQSEQFIQSRFTKLKNIRSEFGSNLFDDGNITSFEHKDVEDTHKVLDFITGIINGQR